MLSVGPLRHELLSLEPLSTAHIPSMAAHATPEEAKPPFSTVPSPEEVPAFVAERLARAASGDFIPFAQVLPDGRVVGHTSYLTLRHWPGSERLLAIEIGSTWLSPAVQGTAVNSVAKLLLMTHAFEVLGVQRLDIKTDERNAQSRAGILAVGARFEGILRGWQPSDAPGEVGLTRNTAMHAVTAEQWPATKAALLERIATKPPAGSASP